MSKPRSSPAGEYMNGVYKNLLINANNGCLGDFDRGRTHTAAILVGEVP